MAELARVTETVDPPAAAYEAKLCTSPAGLEALV